MNEQLENYFTESDFQAMAQELGISCESEHTMLKEQLIHEADNYHPFKEYWENRTEPGPDLKKLKGAAKKLVKQWEELSSETRALLQADASKKYEGFERTIEDVQRLENYIQEFLDYLPKGKRGPNKKFPQTCCIRNLARIYSHRGGKLPGYSTKEIPTAFSQYHERTGPFVRFVTIFFRSVDPSIKESTIGDHIKKHLAFIKGFVEEDH